MKLYTMLHIFQPRVCCRAHGSPPVFITLVKCLCGPRYINFLLTIDILSEANNTTKNILQEPSFKKKALSLVSVKPKS